MLLAPVYTLSTKNCKLCTSRVANALGALGAAASCQHGNLTVHGLECALHCMASSDLLHMHLALAGMQFNCYYWYCYYYHCYRYFCNYHHHHHCMMY